MVDPITANGVTAALRQAAEASELILQHREQGRLPWRARFCYNARVMQLAKFFNSGIERMVYEPPVRNRLGLGRSGTAYTSPAWSMNVVYARLRPKGMISTFLFGLGLALFRFADRLTYVICERRTNAVAAAN